MEAYRHGIITNQKNLNKEEINMKKTKLLLALSLMMSLFVRTVNVNAEETENESYVEINAGSEEDQIENEKILKEKEPELEMIESGKIPRGWGDSVRPALTPVKQQNSYYCGPATVKMIIHQINGSSSAQSTYAKNMGTNSTSGTIVANMTKELNARQTKFKYAHTLITSSSKVSQILYHSIGKNAPIVLHANTRSLEMYNGTSLGHYVAAQTIARAGAEGTPLTHVTYVDPFSANYGKGNVYGSHVDTFKNIVNAVLNRYMIWV